MGCSSSKNAGPIESPDKGVAEAKDAYSVSEHHRVNKIPVKPGMQGKIIDVASSKEFQASMTWEGFVGVSMYMDADNFMYTHSRWSSVAFADSAADALKSVLGGALKEYIAGPPTPSVGSVMHSIAGTATAEAKAMRVARIVLKPGTFDTALAKAKENDSTFAALDGLVGIDMLKVGDDAILALAKYASMSALEAAGPTVKGVMGGMAELFGGPPEMAASAITWTFDPVKKASSNPAPPPPLATVFTTPVFDPEKPTKEFDGAKMWVAKYEGKQFMRIDIPAGFDWMKSAAPMLPKGPDGKCPEWCPATHFGYLESGEMGVEFKDGTKQVVKAGESYLVPPGHRPVMDKAAVMVEFSQDPTWVDAVGAGEAAAKPTTEAPPEAYVCQPCEPELGAPTKDLDGAKMWITKGEGRQMMRIDIPAGFDWMKSAAPMLPKGPDGKCPEWCPATHFGYLESGEMGVEFKDGTKQVVKAGESYLVGPGHRPVMDKSAVMVEFSQDPTWTKAVEASKA